MPADMREWLPASDPVWLVIDAVAQLDTAGLHALRRTGGVGRAGYDPDMLLTVLIWAWAQGQRSSRVIERLCVRDIG
ncbi:transposase, partial [Nocardia sp. NPDC059154]